MPSDLDGLATDLPTTPDDLRALREARRASAMTGQQIVEVARQIPGPTPTELRARPVFRGQPFTLDSPG